MQQINQLRQFVQTSTIFHERMDFSRGYEHYDTLSELQVPSPHVSHFLEGMKKHMLQPEVALSEAFSKLHLQPMI